MLSFKTCIQTLKESAFFNFFFYFNYSYITFITATESNLQYSYIYSYITYVFCFLQIRTLQCNTIFKTILVEERLNKITIYFKRKEKKKQTFTVYRVHYLQFIEKGSLKQNKKVQEKRIQTSNYM